MNNCTLFVILVDKKKKIAHLPRQLSKSQLDLVLSLRTSVPRSIFFLFSPQRSKS